MTSNNTSGFNSIDSCEDSCLSDRSCCSPQGTLKREYPKVGRNDPCPCGSQKKFKKCCGKNT